MTSNDGSIELRVHGRLRGRLDDAGDGDVVLGVFDGFERPTAGLTVYSDGDSLLAVRNPETDALRAIVAFVGNDPRLLLYGDDGKVIQTISLGELV